MNSQKLLAFQNVLRLHDDAYTSQRHYHFGYRIFRTTCASICALILCFSIISLTLSQAYATTQNSSNQHITCDTSYFSANYLNNLADSHLTSNISSLALQFSANAWFNVALMCPSRYSEGIIKSARALTLSHNNVPIDNLTGTQLSSLIENSHNFTQKNDTDANSSSNSAKTPTQVIFHAKTLQAMSVAEDYARFAYEILATRDTEHLHLGTEAYQASLSSEFFAYQSERMSPHNYEDTRKRIYDIVPIIHYTGNDPRFNLSMPIYASLELDTALSELSAIESDSASYTSNPANSNEPTQAAQAIALRIQGHFLKAFRYGAPCMLAVYFDKAIDNNQ